MRFIAKIESKSLAVTISARSACCSGAAKPPQTKLLHSILAGVELAYQNLDSVELGITTVDTYFDTLGGISRAVKRAKGANAAVAPVYIGDQTCGEGTVRTLGNGSGTDSIMQQPFPRWR